MCLNSYVKRPQKFGNANLKMDSTMDLPTFCPSKEDVSAPRAWTYGVLSRSSALAHLGSNTLLLLNNKIDEL